MKKCDLQKKANVYHIEFKSENERVLKLQDLRVRMTNLIMLHWKMLYMLFVQESIRLFPYLFTKVKIIIESI